MTRTGNLIHKALAVETVNKTMFLSHLEQQGKTLAGKSDMNPRHFSPLFFFFLLKEPEEAPRYGSLVYDHICKGESIAVHTTTSTLSFPETVRALCISSCVLEEKHYLLLIPLILKSNVVMSHQQVFKPTSSVEARVP